MKQEKREGKNVSKLQDNKLGKGREEDAKEIKKRKEAKKQERKEEKEVMFIV